MTKLSLRRIACAVMLSGSCMATQAATTNLGTIELGAPTLFQGSMIPAGTFDDIFTFILPPNGGSGYSVVNFPISFPGGSFNTVLSALHLISDPDGVPFNSDDDHLASAVTSPSGSGDSLSLNFGPTGGGSMYLQITGITNGTTGGLYHGGISVSAVPEPEVWAMMLVGVGLVGFRLRNRSKRASASRFA